MELATRARPLQTCWKRDIFSDILPFQDGDYLKKIKYRIWLYLGNQCYSLGRYIDSVLILRKGFLVFYYSSIIWALAAS